MKKTCTSSEAIPAEQKQPDAEDMDASGDGEEELYHKREPEEPPAQQGYR